MLVWSTEVPSRPEFVFSAPSPVTSATFHPYSPHIVRSAAPAAVSVFGLVLPRYRPLESGLRSAWSSKHDFITCSRNCASKHPEPRQVLAGTASGSVVAWDARSPRRTPVQRTRPHKGHCQPVSAGLGRRWWASGS